MATVITHAVSSLDGFIARPDDTVGPLFDWYENGDTELYGAHGAWVFHVSETSARHVQPWWDACRAVVMGRRLFDITNGWNGVPSVGEHVFVVTHEPPSDWIPSDGTTGLTSGTDAAPDPDDPDDSLSSATAVWTRGSTPCT